MAHVINVKNSRYSFCYVLFIYGLRAIHTGFAIFIKHECII